MLELLLYYFIVKIVMSMFEVMFKKLTARVLLGSKPHGAAVWF